MLRAHTWSVLSKSPRIEEVLKATVQLQAFLCLVATFHPWELGAAIAAIVEKGKLKHNTVPGPGYSVS